MNRLLLTFIPFLISSIVFGQNPFTTFKIEKKDLVIISIGQLGPMSNHYDRLAPKYNFNYDNWGEPNLTQIELDSIWAHNEKVDSILNVINGKDWSHRFNEEVKQIYKRDSIVIANLKTHKFIKQGLAKQKKYGNGFIYFVDSTLTEDIYRIQVLGYLNDHYSNRGSYYRVLMRYSDKKILSIDDSIIKISKPIIKTLSIPIANSTDTSYWYKHTNFIIRDLDEEDLKLTKEYYHLRIWTEKQFIDLSYNFRGYEFATITNFTTSKKTGKIHSHTDIVNEDSILILVDSIGLLAIPSENEISCWGKRLGSPMVHNCNDGITYLIEFSSDTTYSFKSYSCPSGWNCNEAAKIDSFFKQLEHLLKLEQRFDKFIQSLPKDCYDNGMIYLRCTDKKSTRKKNRS
ncbi:MAG: hypothetical protein V4590_00365 [Bacteroidota bacterium]